MPGGSKIKHTLQKTYLNKKNKKQKKPWTQVPVVLQRKYFFYYYFFFFLKDFHYCSLFLHFVLKRLIYHVQYSPVAQDLILTSQENFIPNKITFHCLGIHTGTFQGLHLCKFETINHNDDSENTKKMYILVLVKIISFFFVQFSSLQPSRSDSIFPVPFICII